MTVHDGREAFGRYYDEFEVGDVFKHWPGRTITEYDDVLHCMQTMNHHPLHIDARYAAEETQFGKNVVVGTLVYSIVFGMTVTEISGKAIANLEIESLKHTAPTFHGDTVYAETTVTDKIESRSRNDRGIVTVDTRGYNQRGETVLTFTRKVMVPRREPIEASDGAAQPAEEGTASHDTSVHANTPEQARANARMGKVHRDGGGPRRTLEEERRALQRKLYNARRRAKANEDQDALTFIADTLAELKAIRADGAGAEAELQRVEDNYASWMAER